jgi:hypothetical protein
LFPRVHRDDDLNFIANARYLRVNEPERKAQVASRLGWDICVIKRLRIGVRGVSLRHGLAGHGSFGHRSCDGIDFHVENGAATAV